MDESKDTVELSLSHYPTVLITTNIQLYFQFHIFQPYLSWQIYSFIFDFAYFNRIIHDKYTALFSFLLFSTVLSMANIQFYFHFHFFNRINHDQYTVMFSIILFFIATYYKFQSIFPQEIYTANWKILPPPSRRDEPEKSLFFAESSRRQIRIPSRS